MKLAVRNRSINSPSAEQPLQPPGPAENHGSADDLFVWMSENAARYGDIFSATICGSRVYVVSSPDYCERILRRNWRNYARSGQVVKRIGLLLGNGLISSNGAFWSSQRRMIQPAFTRAAVEAFRPLFVAANAELLAAWQQAADRSATVNITRDLSRTVLNVTLQAIFGADTDAVAADFAILADHAPRDLAFAQNFRALGRRVQELAALRERRGTKAEDILGILLAARDRDSGAAMPPTQLAMEVLTLIVAGHETTAGLLNWLWYLLAHHPATDARLAAELAQCDAAPVAPDACPFTDAVIEEALRLYPPLWLMTRRALAADTLGPYAVPAGTEIYISPYLIQRSPALWEMPAAFDPDRLAPERARARPELALCPFGAGPRNCIGEWFARLEMQIHVRLVAAQLRLRHDSAAPPELLTGMNLLSKHDFLMQPQRRVSQSR